MSDMDEIKDKLDRLLKKAEGTKEAKRPAKDSKFLKMKKREGEVEMAPVDVDLTKGQKKLEASDKKVLKEISEDIKDEEELEEVRETYRKMKR